MTQDNKVLVSLALGENDTVLALIGIPLEAWEYMKDGKTHTFDLSAVGIPLQAMIYGTKTLDEAIAIVNEHNKSAFTHRDALENVGLKAPTFSDSLSKVLSVYKDDPKEELLTALRAAIEVLNEQA